MYNKFFLFVFILLWVASGNADDFNKAGRTAFQFLKIGIGARPAALGEACVANINDVDAAFWNSAALTNIESFQAGFSYTNWFTDLKITSGALGFRAPFGVFAVHYAALNYGDIEEALTTSANNSEDTRTGNFFSGSDLILGLSFSRAYTDKLSIGVTAKYLREELFTFTNSLWAFDVGSYYHTGWKGIRLAMSAQNFAQQARWLHTKEEEQQSYELPLMFRLGWSIDLMGGSDLFLGGNPNQQFTFNMDAIHTNDYAERLHIGAEYVLYQTLAFRGGYRFNYEEGNLGLGLGLNYSVQNIQMHIDYAYVSYDFLDSPHRVSVLLEF